MRWQMCKTSRCSLSKVLNEESNGIKLGVAPCKVKTTGSDSPIAFKIASSCVLWLASCCSSTFLLLLHKLDQLFRFHIGPD